MSFKCKFKELRHSKKVSQKELSLEFNVTQTTISKWETGERTPNYETLSKIANYFQVTIDYLLADEAEEKSTKIELLESKELSELTLALMIKNLLSTKDVHTKELALEILKDIVQLSIPKLEALNKLIKTMK